MANAQRHKNKLTKKSTDAQAPLLTLGRGQRTEGCKKKKRAGRGGRGERGFSEVLCKFGVAVSTEVIFPTLLFPSFLLFFGVLLHSRLGTLLFCMCMCVHAVCESARVLSLIFMCWGSLCRKQYCPDIFCTAIYLVLKNIYASHTCQVFHEFGL